MRRNLLILAAVLALTLGAAQAAQAASAVKGALHPTDDGTGAFYDTLANTTALDAQDVHDVIVSGWVNPPESATYEVQVGLVPRAVYDAFQAGTTASLWDEGVYVNVSLSPGGKHLLAAQDYADMAGAPARLNGKARLPFELTLKPRSGRTGGRAFLTVGGDPTNQGKDQLSYGKAAAGGARDEDLSQAVLVCQALADGSGATDVAVKAKQAADSLQILSLTTLGVDMTPRDTFSPGEAVIVQVSYRIASLREKKVDYEVRGQVDLFGDPPAVSAVKKVGRYGFSKNFQVPAKAKPGNCKLSVSLELVRRLIDRTTQEPYEVVVSSDELTGKITVQ